MSPKVALVLWSLFVVGVTYVLTLAFIAPRQVSAREEVELPAVETPAPTLLTTCEAARASTGALYERLDGITGALEEAP